MGTPRVFVTRKIAEEALDMICAVASVEVWPEELPPPYDVLLEKTKDAEGLLSLLTDRVDAHLIETAPKLKAISNLAVGFDNIDIAKATERCILVGNTPNVLTETTADFTFALLMASARRIVEAHNYTYRGLWKTWGPMVMLGQDIHHSILGIIGLGRIGLAVAKRAEGFAMKVIYHDLTRQKEVEEKLGLEYVPELTQLLRLSDFVSLHVPLSADTYQLIGANELSLMKPTAILINTSRGPIVDEEALYQALASHRIFGAALDVTEEEPIPNDSPLLKLDNVIITPHIASASYATRKKMAIMAAENLIAALSGKMPPNCVNPDAFK